MEWFFGELTGLEGVKNYVYLRVKVVFDPPDKQTVMDALKRNIEELEFRLMIQMAGVWAMNRSYLAHYGVMGMKMGHS